MNILDLEYAVRKRGADAIGLPLSNVFIHAYSPQESKTDVWNVCLGRDTGPGTDTVDDTWVYAQSTYEAGIKALLRRPSIWVPTWQERLLYDIHWVPWDITEEWFQQQRSDAAWRECPDAEYMLWVAGRGKAREDVKADAVHAARVLFYDALLWAMKHIPVGEEVQRLSAVAVSREAITAESTTAFSALFAKVPAVDTYVKTKDLMGWWFTRCLIATVLVRQGSVNRAYEVAYYLKKIYGGTDAARRHVRDRVYPILLPSLFLV